MYLDNLPALEIRPQTAFGDSLMVAKCVHHLRKIGLNVCLNRNKTYWINDLIFPELFQKKPNIIYNDFFLGYGSPVNKILNKQKYGGENISLIQHMIKNTLRLKYPEHQQELYEKINFFDHKIINFKLDDNIIKKYDVMMHPEGGKWSTVRHYPYWTELKNLLTQNNISFIDSAELKLLGFNFLKCFNESRIYLGIETGASHLISDFATPENSIIIQSGYVLKEHWAKHYNFHFVENLLDCSPCNLFKPEDCSFGFKCMKDIQPKLILEEIKKRL